MIKISRTSAPPILSTSIAQRRYRLDPVVAALWAMQRGKCCYCEQSIPGSGLGTHVEHFKPQTTYPNLRNVWENLLLACATCNGKKSDEFPLTGNEEQLLLNPSDPNIDPEEHIDFIMGNEPNIRLLAPMAHRFRIGMVEAKNQSRRGDQTIKTIHLQMDFHVTKRARVVRGLERCLYTLHTELKRIQAGDGDLSEVENHKQVLRGAMEDENEYAGVARAFWRKHRLDRYNHVP